MKTFLFSLALFAGQMMTMQEKPVVHLKLHSDLIDVAFAGSLLELSNAPQIVHLPALPPRRDGQGNQWTIDIKNFGPRAIKVVGKAGFNVDIRVDQTVHVYSNGAAYFLKQQ
jgi:hypothetical protein